MLIHEIDAPPPPELQRALDAFERTFTAPLGPGRFYRTDYGGDRTAFIRTLGESRSFAAEKDGKILGYLELAIMNLLLPDGRTQPAAYFADIKMLPEARRTITTARLLQRSGAWGCTKCELGFTMAMDITPQKPPDYSGRAGIRAFQELGRMTVVRIPAPAHGGAAADDGPFLIPREEGEALYRRLALGRYALLGGMPEARSSTLPAWMAHPGGLACGRFEDRRKVRRLITNDGVELRPAYLSCFAFHDARAGADLIAAALVRAARLGYRALRFCAPQVDLAKLQDVPGARVMESSAGTIFGTWENTGTLWNLNAAEV